MNVKKLVDPKESLPMNTKLFWKSKKFENNSFLLQLKIKSHFFFILSAACLAVSKNKTEHRPGKKIFLCNA